jgi:hypothetical protein
VPSAADFSERLVLVPENSSIQLDEHRWPDSLVLHSLKSAFWRDLMRSQPELQWTDIYIEYHHNSGIPLRVEPTALPDKPLLIPQMVYSNLRLLGFTPESSGQRTDGSDPLWCYSFTHRISQIGGDQDYDGEGFQVWVRCTLSHTRQQPEREVPSAAYVRVLTATSNRSLDTPAWKMFIPTVDWKGYSQKFGDAERTVLLTIVPTRAGDLVDLPSYEVLIDLYGTVYSKFRRRLTQPLTNEASTETLMSVDKDLVETLVNTGSAETLVDKDLTQGELR